MGGEHVKKPKKKAAKAQKKIPKKRIILVASRDPLQADVRRQVLEGAGYEVISAMDLLTVQSACREGKVEGAVIGYSLPPAEKRRVWNTMRAVCGANLPVLELLDEGAEPELIDAHALFTHEWRTGTEFAKAVEQLLGSSRPPKKTAKQKR
jgi:hypothetical protein